MLSAQQALWARRIGIIIVPIMMIVVLFEPNVQGWLNSNQGAVTGLLTFMLVLLYFGQNRLQKRQLQLENRPLVDIEEYEEDGSDIRVLLSNLGNGVARDLEIETNVDFEPTEKISPLIETGRLRKVGDEGDRKNRVGNTLKAGAQNTWFVGSPKMAIEIDGEWQGFGLGAGLRRLKREGVEEVQIQFYVKNSDLLGNEYRESIYGRIPFKVDLSDDLPTGVEEIKISGRREIIEA